MSKIKNLQMGFAMFAMLFGAGNVVYPLLLGRYLGESVIWGMLGFLFVAVLLPVIGMVATLLADARYRRFFAILGEWPAKIVILLCMALIGPFAIIPRCIAIAYGAVGGYLSWLSMPIFSVLAAMLIFVATVREGSLIDILGKILGPLKFILLFSLIVFGLLTPSAPLVVEISPLKAIETGFLSALGTADLLGTIFFAGLIFSHVRRKAPGYFSSRELASMGLKVGTIGAVLLGFVYALFAIVASNFGQALSAVPDNEVFAYLSHIILGNAGGLFANVTIAVACLTTSMALAVVFTNYLVDDVVGERLPYIKVLGITVFVAALISNVGFEGIMQLLLPVIGILYPSLIALAVFYIIFKLRGVNYVRTSVAITLLASIALRLFF